MGLIVLQVLIIAMTVFMLFFLIKDLIKTRSEWANKKHAIFHCISNPLLLFFDTLGIGCFAPATSCYKIGKIMDDRLIPGTLNVAFVVGATVESLVYIQTVEVGAVTLLTLVISAAVGGYIGAGVVSKLPVKQLRIGLGAGLLIVAVIMVLRALGIFPSGGEATSLEGVKLVLAAVFCFIFGALMTIGVGAFAPIMAMVYFMGLSPLVAYPIMMGSCALQMPAAGIKFIKEGAYDRKATVYASTVGLVGVFFAVFIVTKMPLDLLKWLVTVVITYTAVVMIKDGLKKPVTD